MKKKFNLISGGETQIKTAMKSPIFVTHHAFFISSILIVSKSLTYTPVRNPITDLCIFYVPSAWVLTLLSSQNTVFWFLFLLGVLMVFTSTQS